MRPILLKALRPFVSQPDRTTEAATVVTQAVSLAVEAIERGAIRLYDSSELGRVRGITHPLFDSLTARVLRLTGRPIWRTHQRSPEQTITLNRILRLVRTGERPVVVVDLDDTLFSMSARHIAIFREYGRQHGVPLMELIGPEHLTSWNKSKILVDNLGLDRVWFERHKDEIEAFWSARFFTDSYIAYDMPLPGAAEYLRTLHEAGAHIVYLSGRYGRSMTEGTLQSLRRHHFPIPDQGRVTLMLKPPAYEPVHRPGFSFDDRVKESHRSDVRSKEAAIPEIQKLGDVVACIDNEPANINLLRKKLLADGNGLAVWMATATARDDIIPDLGIAIIHGFLL